MIPVSVLLVLGAAYAVGACLRRAITLTDRHRQEQQ